MANKVSSENVRKKYIVFYSRDYRHFTKPGVLSILITAVSMIAVIAFYLLNYTDITRALSDWTAGILHTVTGAETQTIAKDYFPAFGPIYIVDMAGTTPSFMFSLICAIVSLALVILLSMLKKGMRSLAIYFCMGAYILLISAVFFIFVPEYFPYSLTDYSELYMKQQVILWITVPSLGGMAIFLLGGKWISGYLTFALIVVVSFLFGCVRYVVNMYILYAGTSIFMASLFFTFGVLFDFLQMVSIYTLYVQILSKRMQSVKNRGEWEW